MKLVSLFVREKFEPSESAKTHKICYCGATRERNNVALEWQFNLNALQNESRSGKNKCHFIRITQVQQPPHLCTVGNFRLKFVAIILFFLQ